MGSDNTEADADDPASNPCGEGFYPVKGEHGQVCVFDYEAASNAFGTATKEQEFICDANDYWKELEERNRIRKKFGMESLTPEQFVVLQAQILEMEARVQNDIAQAKDARDKQATLAGRSSNNMLKSFFGIFEDKCDSNYDCDRPMVCCDFGFKRQCCEGGKTAKNLYGEYAIVPVPQSY
jgi:hypothetical protein